jgi:hypothetical protein
MALYLPIISEFRDKGIKEATKQVNDFSGKVRKSVGKVVDVAKKAALAIGAIGGGAALALKPAIEAAADLEEEISKSREIFGAASAEIEKFASTAARRLGQSKKEAIGAASTFAIFGKSAGLSGSELASFASDFNVLASDLASFFNASPEEAITAIGAALRGESEPIRRFGVLLNDATLREKALQLGLIKNTKQALTPQQKVLAAQAAIYEQTADAQGDFERTSGGLANQQRILKAQFANVVAELGAKFLPIATKIATFLNDTMIPAIQGVVNWFGEKGFKGVLKFITDDALPKLKEKLAEFAKAFVDWIGPATEELLKNLPKIIATILEWLLKDGIPKLIEIATKMALALAGFALMMLPHVIKGLGQFVKELVKEIPSIFKALLDGMLKTGTMIGGYLVDGIKMGLSKGIEIIGNVVKSIINGVLKIIESGINVIFTGINKLIKGAEWTNGPASYPRLPLVNIPALADGGIVSRPTLALIGEAGPEAVVPLNRRSGFSTNGITINVSGALDPVAVARQINDILKNQDARFGY